MESCNLGNHFCIYDTIIGRVFRCFGKLYSFISSDSGNGSYSFASVILVNVIQPTNYLIEVGVTGYFQWLSYIMPVLDIIFRKYNKVHVNIKINKK